MAIKYSFEANEVFFYFNRRVFMEINLSLLFFSIFLCNFNKSTEGLNEYEIEWRYFFSNF